MLPFGSTRPGPLTQLLPRQVGTVLASRFLGVFGGFWTSVGPKIRCRIFLGLGVAVRPGFVLVFGRSWTQLGARFSSDFFGLASQRVLPESSKPNPERCIMTGLKTGAGEAEQSRVQGALGFVVISPKLLLLFPERALLPNIGWPPEPHSTCNACR